MRVVKDLCSLLTENGVAANRNGTVIHHMTQSYDHTGGKQVLIPPYNESHRSHSRSQSSNTWQTSTKNRGVHATCPRLLEHSDPNSGKETSAIQKARISCARWIGFSLQREKHHPTGLAVAIGSDEVERPVSMLLDITQQIFLSDDLANEDEYLLLCVCIEGNVLY